VSSRGTFRGKAGKLSAAARATMVYLGTGPKYPDDVDRQGVGEGVKELLRAGLAVRSRSGTGAEVLQLTACRRFSIRPRRVLGTDILVPRSGS